MEKHTPTDDLENQEFYIDKSAFRTHNSTYTGDNMPDGMDYQGVQWNILMHHTSRENFRTRRTTTYHPHRQFQEKDLVHYAMKKEIAGEPYYTFEKYYKMRGIWCGHFQLKSNILAPTKTDLIYPYKSGFVHYCLLTFKEKKFLIDPELHPVCIDYYDKFVGLAALEGELVLYDMQREKTVFSKPVINDKNINNCIIFLKHKYSPNVRIACGGNDDTIQIFDIQNDVKLLMMLGMTDAVNTLRPSPDTKLLLALGDKKEADIIDLRTGKIVMELEGHEDFGFGGDWHPAGTYVATGNQDCTCRIWDIRNVKESVNVLQAHMDSPNAVKYSPTGSYLVVGENVDYVDIYNVDRNYQDVQVIDFFGEMNGICFDGEEGDNLMVAALLEGFNGVFEFNVRKTEHMDVLSKMMF